jgi:hypothetical protein
MDYGQLGLTLTGVKVGMQRCHERLAVFSFSAAVNGMSVALVVLYVFLLIECATSGAIHLQSAAM